MVDSRRQSKAKFSRFVSTFGTVKEVEIGIEHGDNVDGDIEQIVASACIYSAII